MALCWGTIGSPHSSEALLQPHFKYLFIVLSTVPRDLDLSVPGCCLAHGVNTVMSCCVVTNRSSTRLSARAQGSPPDSRATRITKYFRLGTSISLVTLTVVSVRRHTLWQDGVSPWGVSADEKCLAKVFTDDHSTTRGWIIETRNHGTWWYLVFELGNPVCSSLEHRRRTEGDGLGVRVGERIGVLWGIQIDPGTSDWAVDLSCLGWGTKV